MAAITPEVALVVLALVTFATEVVPPDITAIGVMVVLMLVEPATGVLADVGILAAPLNVLPSPSGAVQVPPGIPGFASSATITVLAMFVLSDGVQRTGIVQLLGRKVAAPTGDDEDRQLGATVALVGPISGFINNTAAVAILTPMVTDLAHEGETSPSKPPRKPRTSSRWSSPPAPTSSGSPWRVRPSDSATTPPSWRFAAAAS